MGIREMFLNIVKSIYHKPKANKLNSKSIPSKMRHKIGFPLLPHLLNIGLEILDIAIIQKEHIKGI